MAKKPTGKQDILPEYKRACMATKRLKNALVHLANQTKKNDGQRRKGQNNK